MISSTSAITLHYLRSRLLFQDGVPLGLLGSNR